LCFSGIFSFFLVGLALDFNLDFFNHWLDYLLGNNWLVDDNRLLQYDLWRLLNDLGLFRRFHQNRFRNDWSSGLRIDDLRLANFGLGFYLADFDVELEFAIG